MLERREVLTSSPAISSTGKSSLKQATGVSGGDSTLPATLPRGVTIDNRKSAGVAPIDDLGLGGRPGVPGLPGVFDAEDDPGKLCLADVPSSIFVRYLLRTW